MRATFTNFHHLLMPDPLPDSDRAFTVTGLDETLPQPHREASRNALPLLLSIPHSGRGYPPWLLAEARHGRRALASLEDPLVDRLAWRAIAAGFGAVIARTPRGAIDCNRALDEVDPAALAEVGSAPVGPRARHGLGIVPSRTPRHGALWKRPLSPDRFRARVEAVYTPYHAAIASGLAALRAKHGVALLLDLHSMPPRAPGAPSVVIGTRHGTSCAPWLADLAIGIAGDCGFAAVLDDPYAGGEIVARHGRPTGGVHALQIEIDRSTYLARDLMSPGHGFDRITRVIARLATGLAEALAGRDVAIAAE